LVFVKLENMFLLYNHNNPWIMIFNVIFVLIPAPLVKNKHIDVLGYNYFLCITSSNINFHSSFNFPNKIRYSSISIIMEYDDLWNCHFLKTVIFGLIHYMIEWQSQIINHNDYVCYKNYRMCIIYFIIHIINLNVSWT
jgi:hypothetical protein